MIGKYVLFGVIAFLVAIIGMLIYPAMHTAINAAGVVGFTTLEEAGMVLLSYAFIIFIAYIIYAHVRK